jgi:hypothetical protein
VLSRLRASEEGGPFRASSRSTNHTTDHIRVASEKCERASARSWLGYAVGGTGVEPVTSGLSSRENGNDGERRLMPETPQFHKPCGVAGVSAACASRLRFGPLRGVLALRWCRVVSSGNGGVGRSPRPFRRPRRSSTSEPRTSAPPWLDGRSGQVTHSPLWRQTGSGNHDRYDQRMLDSDVDQLAHELTVRCGGRGRSRP